MFKGWSSSCLGPCSQGLVITIKEIIGCDIIVYSSTLEATQANVEESMDNSDIVRRIVQR
jgi:hypothetical protein